MCYVERTRLPHCGFSESSDISPSRWRRSTPHPPLASFEEERRHQPWDCATAARMPNLPRRYVCRGQVLFASPLRGERKPSCPLCEIEAKIGRHLIAGGSSLRAKTFFR